MMERQIQAAQYFLDGYNCAQAVFAAFSDMTGLTPEYSARMASAFGGGMGRMREVCGAVSGMLMVTGILYGRKWAALSAGNCWKIPPPIPTPPPQPRNSTKSAPAPDLSCWPQRSWKTISGKTRLLSEY